MFLPLNFDPVTDKGNTRNLRLLILILILLLLSLSLSFSPGTESKGIVHRRALHFSHYALPVGLKLLIMAGVRGSKDCRVLLETGQDDHED